MLKQARHELKLAGLTRIVIGNKSFRRFDGKLMEGIRGGCYGPMSCTNAYIINNNNARENIKAAMLRNGYKQIDEEYEHTILKFVLDKDLVKFTLDSLSVKHDYISYWWVLNK